jgi:hypothetical protein
MGVAAVLAEGFVPNPVQYVELRYGYFRLCREHARKQRGISLAVIVFGVYEFLASVAPLVQIPRWSLNLPRLPLPWAVTIVLAAITYIAIEGGYTLREAEAAARATEDERQRPQVVVTCDWPSNRRDLVMFYAKSPTPLPKLHNDLFNRNNFFVQVLTDIAATNVQVQDVALEKGTAHFDVVSLLQRDKSEEPCCTIERPSGGPVLTAPAWNLESLIYDSYRDKVSDTSDIANSCTPAIPILARYTDLNGRSWESVNELTYNLVFCEGKMRHVKIRKAS